MADLKKEPAKKHYANIAGVQIDLDHESIKKAASADDIAKLGIFNHLKDDEKKSAEADLFTAKSGVKPVAAEATGHVDKEKDKTT